MAKKLILKLPPIDLTELLNEKKLKPYSPKQLLKVRTNKK
jgi:hypothetical protein